MITLSYNEEFYTDVIVSSSDEKDFKKDLDTSFFKYNRIANEGLSNLIYFKIVTSLETATKLYRLINKYKQ